MKAVKLKLETEDSVAVLHVLGEINHGHPLVLKAGILSLFRRQMTFVLDLSRVDHFQNSKAELSPLIEELRTSARNMKILFKVVCEDSELGDGTSVKQVILGLPTPLASLMREERNLKTKVELLEKQRKELQAELLPTQSVRLKPHLEENSKLKREIKALEAQCLSLMSLLTTIAPEPKTETDLTLAARKVIHESRLLD
jgi:hypothetical protein